MDKFSYGLASTTWDQKEIEVSISLLSSGNLTMGPKVLAFEREFADYIGTKHAVMFNSGSSANLGLLMGLRYMKNSIFQDGDHVIVPSVSWSTTYYPVNQAGLILDFVDVDPISLNINVDDVINSIKPNTRAIFAVNLLGNPAQLLQLSKIAETHNLILIEDNCESLGADINGIRTGSLSFAGTHSFFFSHHICTMEGGMVTTNSSELAEAMISIRAHGWTRGLPKNNSVHDKSDDEWEDLFRFVLPGFNLRPMELSGAIGSVQLEKFPDFLSWRRRNAEIFCNLFSGVEEARIQGEFGNSSWFGFSLILQGGLQGKRREIIEKLRKSGVETRPVVAGNFTRNPVMKHLKFSPLRDLKHADEIHNNGFFIGNHHYDVREKLEKVYEIFNDAKQELI